MYDKAKSIHFWSTHTAKAIEYVLVSLGIGLLRFQTGAPKTLNFDLGFLLSSIKPEILIHYTSNLAYLLT